jgi:hypothetical protein
MITFTDEYSGYTTIFPLKYKSDTFLVFQRYCKAFFAMHGSNSIKILRSDNGAEYMSKSFQLMCRDNGINQQITAPFLSFQNGVAERKNRTIIEGTRALLLDAQADQSLWIYAALFENKMLNCVFVSKRQAIPYEVFHGHPSIKYLNTVEIWGSPVWVHVHQKHRNKLETTAKAGIYLGQDSSRKSIIALVNNKAISSRDYKIKSSLPNKTTLDEREYTNNVAIESSSDEIDSNIELSQTKNINGSPNSIENVEGENYTDQNHDQTQSRKEQNNENNRPMRKVSDLQNQRRNKIQRYIRIPRQGHSSQKVHIRTTNERH